MAVNTKTIKRRIRSITNTRKITRAMEMISAVKMRRAVANVLSTRSYSNLAWEMLNEVAKKTYVSEHPLLHRRVIHRIGVILITSNRGLAGGFSSRLLQLVDSYIKENKTKYAIESEVILTGRHGKKIYHKFGHNVVAEFNKIDLTTTIDEVLPMAQLVIKDYIEGKFDKIVIAYTDFNSALVQTPRIKQILPLQYEADPLLDKNNIKPAKLKSDYGYIFEPGAKQVLDILMPRLVEMQVYQAILESDASEHSARMLAMRNASDAAKDMIKELNYSFNKARQAAITQEISEIVGGAAALE